MLLELVSSGNLAEQEAGLHTHHVPPLVSVCHTALLTERGEEKDLPRTPLGSWADRRGGISKLLAAGMVYNRDIWPLL